MTSEQLMWINQATKWYKTFALHFRDSQLWIDNEYSQAVGHVYQWWHANHCGTTTCKPLWTSAGITQGTQKYDIELYLVSAYEHLYWQLLFVPQK